MNVEAGETSADSTPLALDLSPYVSCVRDAELTRQTGRLVSIHGMILEASGCDVHLGELVKISQEKGGISVLAEVVGLENDRILLMPFQSVHGLSLNSVVAPLASSLHVPVGDGLLGRVIDPMGEPLDNLGALTRVQNRYTQAAPINPMMRKPISQPLYTGISSIDLFCPLGLGQRIGVMAGSGVGKSTLLGMLARHSDADVIVIALIGERGRELNDFLRDALGESGLAKAVVVIAAAEQTAVMRKQTAYTATTIAEHFRAEGKDVLLIMDSITRFAMAQREIGMSIGEPVGTRGYPPSVFALLPPLVERSGSIFEQGSITSVYTVLVEGDDLNEPVTDHMRSILDGHLVLTRELADMGHYPAVDIQASLSRLSNSLLTKERREIAQQIRRSITIHNASKDLIDMGAYEKGRNVELDNAIEQLPAIKKLLRQNSAESVPSDHSWSTAKAIAALGDTPSKRSKHLQ